jgi:hypothetical protein
LSEVEEDKLKYERWLQRKDLSDLWEMLPEITEGKKVDWVEPFILKEVARYTDLIEANMDLFGNKFADGILSYEVHIWDRAYKRVLVDAYLCLKFNSDDCKNTKRETQALI